MKPLSQKFCASLILIALVGLGPILVGHGPAVWAAEKAADKQKLPPAVIAVIDLKLILREAQAAKSVRAQIEKYRAAYLAQMKKSEGALNTEQEELKRQRTLLSPEAFSQRRRKFEDKVAAVQRQAQDRSRRLERSYSSAMNKLRGAMLPIIIELTKTRGFNLVLEKSQILFAHRGLELTKVVLKGINERLPEGKVPPPDSN